MLRVENLSKIFANSTDRISGGISEANFELEPGTFFTMLGPSGCGKTTTLRCIAGLETPDAGVISIDGEALFDRKAGINIPVERRAVGMVFQSYAIWPHMTVAENVAFPLTVAKDRNFSRAEIEAAVNRALTVVNLGGYQQRSATQLSGGEQQRVALARAIVREPRLLLLDEPLSNLDAQLRDEMRSELKRLQSKIGITTVYVTHDQSEALALSDQIAVINRGRIRQIGSPHDIYYQPADAFVARFVGATNLLDGRLIGAANGRGEVEVSGGRRLKCLVPHRIDDGSSVSVSIRPESIQLVAAQPSPGTTDGNCLAGRLSAVTFLGSARRVDVSSEGLMLQVTMPADMPLPADKEVLLVFAPERTIALPRAIPDPHP
ncbi:MAG: spermidine/putrescine transport system ATP-binding protein [Alphaproteobacteria bacterium]|nr:spermidine/putrescine transport system ATP-binding protein [Alphaproteobacteria bacterium]